ncbi:MAG: peptide-methionine (S)-S-oxide reductase MsrA [Hyphomicrobiales bacterium]
MFLFNKLQNKLSVPTKESALPGRAEIMPVPSPHFVNGNPIKGPFPDHLETAYFALGCFWGAERIFWKLDGVYSTAVGYMAGHTLNPTYQEVCSGQTGHTEAVLVVFDPSVVSFETLMRVFWEGHDPTQGMRQGNDTGTQYRSGVYLTTQAQLETASASKAVYQTALREAGKSDITSDLMEAPEFFYAEDYHQQYLAKNPNGYCGIGGTGISCPIPTPINS